MLHPSYTDLMQVVNEQADEGEHPVIQSRYSIVMATSKRARDIIDGATPLVSAEDVPNQKPLSIAIEELYQGKLKIVAEDGEE